MTTTLLAKDTSHRTVFPVFTPGGGFGMPEMQGGGDFVMVADPATFRVLPWAREHRLGAVRHLFHQRQAGAVLDAPALPRCAGEARQGRLRFSRRPRGRIPSVQDRQPAACAGGRDLAGRGRRRSATSRRAFSISPRRASIRSIRSSIDPAQDVEALGLPLRSLEVELGPSQYEFTFGRETGLAAADTMVLFRSGDEAGRAPARLSRQLHVPAGVAEHVLQRLASASVADREEKRQATRSSRTTARTCCRRSAALSRGLLAHARAAAAFTTPTINGYKRYRAYSLAPTRRSGRATIAA